MTCFKCKHFTLKWGQQLPYVCKAWGIRSLRYPGLMVRASSGYSCQLYQPKAAADRPQPTSRQSETPQSRVDKII